MRGAISQTIISAVLVLALAVAAGYHKQGIYALFQNSTYRLGLNLNNIASQDYVEWIKSLPQNYSSDDDPVFLNKTLSVYYKPQELAVLGEITASDSKWIEIDLSEQRLYMKENGNTVNSFLVSTGKWSPTPKGGWRIWTKLISTRMVGGSKALGTYYNLPNVPYTMYYDRGYGMHGAYWHNNFGQPMSHGCTNMRPEEAKIVFDWAQVGTRVIVRD
ncbi:L,D-transpeptidase [Candidatus Curtissbacteria bacterium]|nr:L,D-transpeptidase [Candidatus Curtissbacteria bacterium]